jgi:hypothetical protein
MKNVSSIGIYKHIENNISYEKNLIVKLLIKLFVLLTLKNILLQLRIIVSFNKILLTLNKSSLRMELIIFIFFHL